MKKTAGVQPSVAIKSYNKLGKEKVSGTFSFLEIRRAHLFSTLVLRNRRLRL
jgi:hypothetical protein